MRWLIFVGCLAAVSFGYPQSTTHVLRSEDQETAAASHQRYPQTAGDDSDMYMEALEHQPTILIHHANPSTQEPLVGSQTFYPAFSPFGNQPPLGHSRPSSDLVQYQQEGAYSHRPHSAFQQQVDYDSAARFSGYKGAGGSAATNDNFAQRGGGGSDSHAGLLGSGNFGVIRGGTFYHENDEASSGGGSHGSNYEYDPFFQNGHGRPSSFGYSGNPKPRQHHQQFENFRDFADINVPANPAYSQYVVVYANRNTTEMQGGAGGGKPKNIIEHLQMLDLEKAAEAAVPEEKKVSKAKRKLKATAKTEKKPLRKAKTKSGSTTTSSSIDLYEPLLALS